MRWNLVAGVLVASFLAGCGGGRGVAPVAETATPSAPSISCAQEWVACDAQPIGSLIESAKRHPLTPYYKNSCNVCDESCACVGGKATGPGFVRWCDSSSGLCAGADSYGIASGELRDARFVAKGDHILVVLNTAKGKFSGRINADGSYDSGALEVSDTERFVGKFDATGNYRSGILYMGDRVVIANEFVGRSPIGRTLIADDNGQFTESECTASGCRVLERSHSSLLAELFGVVAENRIEDAALRTALAAIGREALLMNPFARAWMSASFAADILGVFESSTQ